MLIRTSVPDIMQAIRRSRGLPSILLDDGYANGLIREIIDQRRAFDLDNEDRWDLIIPAHRNGGISTVNRRHAIRPPRVPEYSPEVARQMIEFLGVPKDRCPCVVFLPTIGADGFIYQLKETFNDQPAVFRSVASALAKVVNEDRRGLHDELQMDLFREARSIVTSERRLNIATKSILTASAAVGLISGLYAITQA